MSANLVMCTATKGMPYLDNRSHASLVALWALLQPLSPFDIKLYPT